MRKERHVLTVEIKGRKYDGYRIIEQQNNGEMSQLIQYKMRHALKDLRRYKPGQEKIMESVARMILEDLVRESEKSSS